MATPSSGVISTTLAIGALDEIHAKVVQPKFQVRIDTKGASDVHVLENRLAPGATFGWHSHPGPSIVVVKSGALWVYKADAPGCGPEIVTTGHSFVDGGSDVHMVRDGASSRPSSTWFRSSRPGRSGGSTSRPPRAVPPDLRPGPGGASVRPRPASVPVSRPRISCSGAGRFRLRPGLAISSDRDGYTRD